MTEETAAPVPVLVADGLVLVGDADVGPFALTLAPGALVSVPVADTETRDLLALTLAGRLAPAAGTLTLDGSPGLGWLPGLRLYEDLARVEEVLRDGRRILGVRTTRDEAARALVDAGLAGVARTPAERLRPVAKATLGVLVAAAPRPPVLVSVLPAGRDDDVAAFHAVVGAAREAGTAVVVVTTGTPPDRGSPVGHLHGRHASEAVA
ncbi:hypothetical protein [Cellulomonas sp. PhB143]|uniref:hypothetical protein n=1 Tax=Cellulomonas sp. PhB143 TaxID=2485186 RepID=UPI000F46BE3A|nr:hypothetical protein [Cellulomonas sp. PhB143]ROS75394.1 hypothetical protein EDF32_1803 [Cellulomonas sp. PhB143]